MGQRGSTIQIRQKQVYESLRKLQQRSEKQMDSVTKQFQEKFGKEIQVRQDSKVLRRGDCIRDEVGEELKSIKSVSWGKNYQAIQDEITEIIETMSKQSHGTSSFRKGYFPVVGKYGICYAAYGIYFEKIKVDYDGKKTQSQSINYVFGTYEYEPEGGWTKARIGMLVEASPISQDRKDAIYESLVQKLTDMNDNQKQKALKN